MEAVCWNRGGGCDHDIGLRWDVSAIVKDHRQRGRGSQLCHVGSVGVEEQDTVHGRAGHFLEAAERLPGDAVDLHAVFGPEGMTRDPEAPTSEGGGQR
jgi:hypothetical protein